MNCKRLNDASSFRALNKKQLNFNLKDYDFKLGDKQIKKNKT